MKRKKVLARLMENYDRQHPDATDFQRGAFEFECRKVLDAIRHVDLMVIDPLVGFTPPTLEAEPEKTREPTTLVCQIWYESEAGWGQRPDGYTLHLTVEDCKAFVEDYYKRNNPTNYVPHEYTQTSGDPKPVSVPQEVSWEDYDKVVKLKGQGKLGVWFSEWSPESRMKAAKK